MILEYEIGVDNQSLQRFSIYNNQESGIILHIERKNDPAFEKQ